MLSVSRSSQSDLLHELMSQRILLLEDGMRMAAALVDTIPLGVDTPADLERARKLLAG